MQETNSEAKLSEIANAFTVPLQVQCNCSLSVQQSLFSCLGTTDSQAVVFLAQLSYTALPGVDMPFLLTSWVTSTPYIAVASTQLQVDATCPVVIGSLVPEICPVAFVTPPTDPHTDIIVTAVSVFGVMAIIVVAIVITAVIVVCRKQSRNKKRYTAPLYFINLCVH